MKYIRPEVYGLDTTKYLNLVNRTFYKKMGKVSKVVGLTIESIGPDASLNDCLLYTSPSPRD